GSRRAPTTAGRRRGCAKVVAKGPSCRYSTLLWEDPMTDKANVPYHIADQRAVALLPPVATELAALESRLAQYVTRINMPDADRALVAQARDALTDARSRLTQILAASSLAQS